MGTGYRAISTLRVVSPTQLVVVGSSATKPTELALLTLPTAGEKQATVKLIKASSSAKVDPEYISEAVSITFPTKKIGNESDAEAVAYGYYYAPKNKEFIGLEGETAPLVVRCHGTLRFY